MFLLVLAFIFALVALYQLLALIVGIFRPSPYPTSSKSTSINVEILNRND